MDVCNPPADSDFIGHKAVIVSGSVRQNLGKLVTVDRVLTESCLTMYVLKDENGYMIKEPYFKADLVDLGTSEQFRRELISDRELRDFLE